ncbi:hypothetical protein HPP92_019851 [Vanilla planifolia]|uniref:Uncharacterized protein n=1 Tax=Vanilla planifolia TaxID=51239 RepID=A0A835Q9K9_VANPL|nr:hypothetical protein HPP92_019851 [Vanilla planifolia]
MCSGTLGIALECHRHVAVRRSASLKWRLYCNGRRVGYASKRRPNEKDVAVLWKVRMMSAGTGVIRSLGDEEGELIYMRASYERVVGSRDTVSYHLINPSGGSPSQELSIFLLRTR